jgi:DNA segregation ATPase FtsK/SpoIIIE, S-DNA-T family
MSESVDMGYWGSHENKSSLRAVLVSLRRFIRLRGGLLMDLEISITDMRDAVSEAEIDCVISAEPQHRVSDLSAGLLAMRGGGWTAEPPGIWLDGSQLDPSAPLTAAGIHAGSRVGFGGRPPASRTVAPPARPRPGWGTGPGEAGPAAPELRVVSGPDAGFTAPLAPGDNVVGRQHADVRLRDTDVSRAHFVVAVSPDGGYLLSDAGSTNGTGLAGVRVGPQAVPVRPGQLIYAGRDVLTIAVPDAGNTIALRADPANPFGWLVNKPFRTVPALPAPITIDLGSKRSEHGRPPWLTMLIAPVLSLATGGIIAAVTHQWLFVLLGLGGVAASVVPQLLNRRTAAGHARTAKRESQDAAVAGQARLGEAIETEERLRRQALPDPATLADIATGPGTRLWERSPQDKDFLLLRAGSGDLAASTISLRGSAADAAGTPGPTVRDVPIAIPLADLGVLGIAGPPAASRPALAWAVSQLAVLHGPGDLRLVLLTEQPRAWRWARWLPQLRPPGEADWLSVGTDPATWTKRVAELRDLVTRRQAAAADAGHGYSTGRDRPLPLPCVVLVIDGSDRIRDVPGIGEVLSAGPAAGVFVICRDDDWRDLPGACRGRLDTDPGNGGTGVYLERDSGHPLEVARLDLVSERWADETARALAPIRDKPDQGPAGTNAVVRMNDLFGIPQLTPAAVQDLWRRGGGRTTAVPLGRLADGSPFVVDIAAQGPHMLVGGTTGSGKSQFLQTLVASLALGSTPQALNFVLIDYKGGATFKPCRDLPHVSGYLTDLDEHLGQRALAALEAETRYREWLITTAAGCADLESYWAAGEPRGPLPRLLVIADEFRFLKETMPEVLKGMTDLAARGRSIGIHLVLATQSPAKAITEDIRDNTRLRVCFRVEEKEGSVRVIDIPDAAAIDPAQQGRGYARVSHGDVAQFQGAWASAPADRGAATGTGTGTLRAVQRPFGRAGEPLPDGRVAPQGGRSGYSGPTDLSELVKAVKATGLRPPERRPWLDPLPPRIPLAALPAPGGRAGGPLVPIGYGVADLPGKQCQEVLAFDIERGSNLLIGGAAQSGRTTALRTITAGIATGCSPADLHLYVLDCAGGALGPLDRLPHCGAVVRHTETERAARLLDRLDAEISHRRDLLSAEGFASVTEQRGRVAAAERLPYLVLLLDSWETFAADLGQLDSGRLTTTLNRLISQGASAGLRVIVTGGLAALSKLASNFSERIVLRLSGPNDLYSAGVPRGAMPAQPTEGRGLLLPAATEVQIAFAGPDPSGAAQTAAMNELIGAARAAFPASVVAPLRVDPLPARIALAKAVMLPGWSGRAPLRPALAVGGDDLAWLGPDLDRVPWFGIAGPIESGKSMALVVLAESLLAAGTPVIGLAPRPSPLRGLDGRDGVIEVFTDAGMDPRKLAELLNAAAGPLVVLADDAEALMGKPVDQVLSQVPTEGRGQGQALVVAGAAADLSRPARSFATAGSRYRCGLLLTPEDVQQPIGLFGARLPRSAVFSRPAGRGYLFQAGQSVLVQVPEIPGS